MSDERPRCEAHVSDLGLDLPPVRCNRPATWIDPAGRRYCWQHAKKVGVVRKLDLGLEGKLPPGYPGTERGEP
jgi:hypothetical protein